MFDEPRKASVGNGEGIEVWRQGEVDVRCELEGESLSATLTQVSFIPGLTTNLVSVGAHSKRNLSVVFSMLRCTVDGIMTGKLEGDELYVLNIVVERTQAQLAIVSRTLDEWHKVMGYGWPSDGRLLVMLREGGYGVEGTGPLSECPSCLAGKATHVQHPERTTGKVEEVGQRVHVNLGVISNETKQPYEYVV